MIDFTTLAFGNYSLSEVDTGFTWTDGKTIYKKTVVTTFMSAGEKSIAHGVSNFGHPVKIEGYAVRNDGKMQPLPAIVPQYNTQFSISLYDITSTTVAAYIGSSISSVTLYLTLYYTKAN